MQQVVLSFYESRRKQPWALGFGAQEERLFWEQWCGISTSSNCCHSAADADSALTLAETQSLQTVSVPVSCYCLSLADVCI